MLTETKLVNDSLIQKLNQFGICGKLLPLVHSYLMTNLLTEVIASEAIIAALNEAIIANPFKPYCYSNVDVNTNLWYEWIFKLIEIHVPVRTKNRQLLPPWTSHHMNKIKTERRKLQKKGLCTSEKLKKLTEECNQLQINDRVEYEQKLFASRHKGRIYKYLKSLKKDSLPPVIKSENLKREASTDLEKANLFNNYFATVVTDDGYEYFEPSEQHNFGENDILITEDLIKTELKSLNISKSRGQDSIPPLLFKRCGGSIAMSLKNLFCNIKRLRKFPSAWKTGIVSPIYKDGDKREVSNYRPVTLLNIVAKLFEKFIFASLYTAFADRISNFQFGFRPRRSVVLQLLYSLSHIYSHLNSRDSVNLFILFDFSKAFDKIKHSILMKKLLQIPISKALFELIQDYLLGRTQKVRIGDQLSNERTVTSGVPQGSVLGPLFFLIYINDLPNAVFSSLALLFADDLKLLYNGRPEQESLEKLQTDLQALHNWSVQNHLLFNLKKCSISEFQYGRNKNTLEDFCFIMNGRNLNHKSLVRDVGLFMDESLNWNEHVKVRVGMARKSFFRLRRSTSPIICTKSKVDLYRSIISMSMLSASECWELRKTNFEIIEKFNKKVLKWICGNFDYKDALIKSNLLPPLYIKVLKDLLLFSNILEGRYNVDFSKEFNITNSGRRRRVVLPDTRFEIQRQNFWYRTGFRINVVQRALDFFNPENLKNKLIEYMWSYFNRHWTENNPCTWIFICLCTNCRANPRL